MHINQSEGRKHSQVSYLKTRSVSVDSGFGDEEVISKTEVTNKANNSVHTALKAVKKGKRKFEKWQKKSSVDIRNIRDEEGSNILHLIARLKKKQKCRSLNFLIERISEEDLAKLVDSKNRDGKTPLQVALIDKITKGKHGSRAIQDNDNTLKFLVTLLEHGAKPDQLSLSAEDLGKLSKKQNEYYRKFLEKLAESIKKPELKSESEIETKIKEIIPYTINTPDNSSNYLLHLAINDYNKKRFKELLEKGADISLKDANGNNALHLIVTELKKEERLKFLNILLKVGQEGQFIKAVNNKNGNGKNSDGQTPLHQLLQRIEEKSKKSSLGKKIQNIVKKDFKDTSRYKTLELLLQNGADITVQDKEGNNALHYIASFKGKQKVTCLNLILDLAKERKIVKDQLGKAVNSKNQEGQIPLHQLLQHIKRKNEDRSCTDRKFEETKRYETLKLLLQNGADITAQDKEGKNALHHIALLKGEQKVACLDLIVKEGNMPEISKAVNAKNDKKQTPLQVALIAKTVKNKHSKVNFISRDNTIKFCVKLLQNGADPKQLILPESLWSREYYKTIKGMEKSMGKLLIPDDMRTELKLNFGKKFKAYDIMKYVNSVVCKVVTTLVFVAVTCAVVFSAAQGSITIATASSLIAAIGVCYLIYLNLENIYEGFKKLKGKFTGEKQPTLRDDVSKNDTQCNDSSKSMENKPNGLEEQKAQDQSKYTESSPSSENDRNSETQKSSDQPEHKNPPNSRMNDTHIEPHEKQQGVQRN
ncbi:MAG: ankyrin repeat domain-containing protein [Wolbachia endosymbiont of Penenirmus auritus]|nr:ankyrin repeat domain-containing protein [Wolbachia endosymbiont of Penenirmus auritus]